MKITVLIGSLRQGSYNLQLAHTMKERYINKIDLEIADIRSLPFFDQDIELNPPQVVKELLGKVATADGVFIITPEYNWSVPGVLKNAIDWLSRLDKVLIGKPVLTAGVSPGMMGTIRAQLHLREILASPGIQAKLLPPAGNEIYISSAGLKFDETTSRLVDESTLRFIDRVMDKFIEFAQK
ncbi:NADPH-dependent FMN reductase [Cohnella cholangitidis]|uniref:NAD(P)H-dependent oxidoreductase n=1 Tax=Cohnella cholangitidis TaxID=2598458 RepID=A0A7G5C6J3_9BACL|nr:NADPH-dependent FMN reductase [Cohnella cholangitidis]QMV44827.1 NAD(P)H-dependent oxidoreductase [Cohnella cholangitidis]